MKPSENNQALITGDYLICDQRGNSNKQVVSTRWEFIQALLRKLPTLGEWLRKEVYPNLRGPTPAATHEGCRDHQQFLLLTSIY
jgi:hypothetical protein